MLLTLRGGVSGSIRASSLAWVWMPDMCVCTQVVECGSLCVGLVVCLRGRVNGLSGV